MNRRRSLAARMGSGPGLIVHLRSALSPRDPGPYELFQHIRGMGQV